MKPSGASSLAGISVSSRFLDPHLVQRHAFPDRSDQRRVIIEPSAQSLERCFENSNAVERITGGFTLSPCEFCASFIDYRWIISWIPLKNSDQLTADH